MPFPGTGVEDLRDPVALRLRQRIKIHSFRQILTDQSVGVLVRSTFPRVMRIREVELDTAP